MTAASVNGGNELLRNHAPEVEGQVKKNLLLLVFREKVQDTVQSLVGVVGVQGGQTQMSGFGKGDGMLHGFTRAHLANENHIVRLAQRVTQGPLERLRIDAHLAL